MVVHVIHALEQGEKTILIHTLDTDVVAILVGIYHTMVAVQPNVVIWVAFEADRHYRFYSINVICCTIREPRPPAIPVFHAFSGCDTTSAFNGKGKKSVWQPGRLTKKSPKHWCIWLFIPLKNCTKRPNPSRS